MNSPLQLVFQSKQQPCIMQLGDHQYLLTFRVSATTTRQIQHRVQSSDHRENPTDASELTDCAIQRWAILPPSSKCEKREGVVRAPARASRSASTSSLVLAQPQAGLCGVAKRAIERRGQTRHSESAPAPRSGYLRLPCLRRLAATRALCPASPSPKKPADGAGGMGTSLAPLLTP